MQFSLPSSPPTHPLVQPSPGAAGGGEHWPEYHPGGGEGAQGQRQRARTDALPGGGSALLVTCILIENVWKSI